MTAGVASWSTAPAAAIAAVLWLAAPEGGALGALHGDLAETVRARGLDPAALIDPGETTAEMRAWIRERVPEAGSATTRLRRVLEALLLAGGLEVQYDPDQTSTAREVFESGRANCLSFTHLFVAMAREVGLEAYYVEIERPRRYDQEGDLVLVWEHVTAGWGPPERRTVLEFDLGPTIEGATAARLSDLTALAMYYSNRGAQFLREGDWQAARGWLETAIRIDPDWSPSWLNLGVALRRSGDEAGAESAYRRAIEADPMNLQAYYNLAGLYRLRGEKGASSRILRLLDRQQHDDPFIFLALGDASLEEGLLDDARRFYRRALGVAPKQPEVRAAMGLLELAAGRAERARTWLRRAERGGGGGARLTALRRRLAPTPVGPAGEGP